MLDDVFSYKNLELAWQWVKSNPDRNYKLFFRSSYQKHELIKEQFLTALSQDLSSGTYAPSTSCKVFLPKPSGILRPYSLLTVQDQVVYQAFLNVLAEKLGPKVQKLYNRKNFGHQYAGKNSTWFYKKWSSGYTKFNDEAVSAYDKGQIYGASFDLTACYDSIDHGVLSYYLKQLGFDIEFCNALCAHLSQWTATKYDEPIYQGHGIPQGPLSSGLLSEVVLNAFDKERLLSDVTYLRYVDDIRLFSTTESSLRSQLVVLDRISKKVGLFPQSGKIKIHRISDIQKELKTLSVPTEQERWEIKDQKLIRKDIITATPRYNLEDITGFKYNVSLSNTNNLLTTRLWRIYEKHPSTYPVLCNYLKKYRILPQDSFVRILSELKKKNPYDAIKAEFISVLMYSDLDEARKSTSSSTIKSHIYRGGKSLFLDGDVSLSSNAARFLIKHGSITSKQLEYAIKAPYWFTRLSIAEALLENTSALTPEARNLLIKDRCVDVSIATAEFCIKNKIKIDSRLRYATAVGEYLKSYAVAVDTSDQCKIDLIVRKMFKLKESFPSVNWTDLLKDQYPHGLMYAVACNAAHSTNPGAWLNEIDAFNEVIVRGLFANDTGIGIFGARYGSIFTGGKTTRFYKKYPVIFDECKDIHDRRVTSPTSHAYSENGQKTVPFRYKEIKLYSQKIVNLLSSLATSYPVEN